MDGNVAPGKANELGAARVLVRRPADTRKASSGAEFGRLVWAAGQTRGAAAAASRIEAEALGGFVSFADP